MSQVYPKISIVTVNYNYGHFLEQTIVSVLNQNYPNLEYIIIDGGSTDNSIEIIKKYEKHLAYWVSEPDKGMYDAINKGFKKSTGDIMAWINSDDMYLPWTFKTVAEAFSTLPDVQWISSLQPGLVDYKSEARWFGSINGFSKDAFVEGRYAGRHAGYEFIQQESTFWIRQLWETAGGQVSTNYSLAGDFELWNRFYKHARLYGIINPLALFRYNFQQKSYQFAEYLKQCEDILSNNKTPSNSRSFFLKLRLNRMPVIRSLLKRSLQYDSFNIVRQDRENNSSCWKIEKAKFI